MKKMLYIYSKNLKRKKLYYFMKFYKIIEILKIKDNKSNLFFNNGRRTYNKLYNDYQFRNEKKENMEINQLYNESELYPFSPLINHSGYMTFRPYNYTPNISRYNSFKKNNHINQKSANFIEQYPKERNILTENNLFNKKNYSNYNDYLNNNEDFQNYPNDYFENDNIDKYSNLKKNYFNNTDYRFYSPIHKPKKKKNITNRNEDINSQISEYLNNFQNSKKRTNLLHQNNINNLMKNNNDLYSQKRNKSYNNIVPGNKYNITGKVKSPFISNNEKSYDINYKRNREIDNYFNKSSNNNKNNNNLIFKKDNFNYKNNKYPFKKEYGQNNNNNNNKLYNESKDYNINKKVNTKNNQNNYSKKNSNASLNPSSLGIEHTKTFYTNKQKTSNNNLNIGNSNINSASSRAFDTQNHFVKELKMASGEVNEYFYDFNSVRRGKDKNDDQKSVQSLQSLSDSKMLELANHYLSEEDDSVENYQMNNIIFSKKKMHNMKK